MLNLRDYVNNPGMLQTSDGFIKAKAIYPVRYDIAIVEVEHKNLEEGILERQLGYFSYAGIGIAPRNVLGVKLQPRIVEMSKEPQYVSPSEGIGEVGTLSSFLWLGE